MDPTASLRLRTFTAGIAVAWAVLAIVLSAAGLVAPESRMQAPFRDSRLGGMAIIEWLHPAAEGSGLEEGDLLLEADGQPYTSLIAQEDVDGGVLGQCPVRLDQGGQLHPVVGRVRIEATPLGHHTVLLDPHETPAARTRVALAGAVGEDARPGAVVVALQHLLGSQQLAASAAARRAHALTRKCITSPSATT